MGELSARCDAWEGRQRLRVVITADAAWAVSSRSLHVSRPRALSLARREVFKDALRRSWCKSIPTSPHTHAKDFYPMNNRILPPRAPGTIQVDGAEAASEVLSRGFRNRHVGETAMNRESSRSHAVFTLVIKADEVVEEEGLTRSRVARFNLVDLAGSERQKDTQVSKNLSGVASCHPLSSIE